MKQTLLALAAFAALSATPAFAQKLDRRPASSVSLLRASAKSSPEVPAVIVPVAMVAVDPQPEFNGQSTKLFATKVHAILMNACATCHGRNDYSGAYKLKKVAEGYANAEGVERNLAATVKQLDRDNPAASPFLVKAVAPHGKSAEAPLHSKNHPAYKYLEVWAYWASMPEGSPMPTTIPQAAIKKPEPAALQANPIQVVGATAKPEDPAKLPTVAAKNFAVAPKASDPGQVNPDDPFDPGAFNRAAHPAKK